MDNECDGEVPEYENDETKNLIDLKFVICFRVVLRNGASRDAGLYIKQADSIKNYSCGPLIEGPLIDDFFQTSLRGTFQNFRKVFRSMDI